MGFSLLCTLTVSNSEFFDWCSIGVVFWQIRLIYLSSFIGLCTFLPSLKYQMSIIVVLVVGLKEVVFKPKIKCRKM